MKFFRMLPYFTHVLPLEYDLSLTPYEILSKLFKWLDELTPVVNQHSEEILKIKEELSKFSEEGLTQTIYEILDDMAENGRFDFLLDVVTSMTIFNQLAGVTPYAQLIPERNITGFVSPYGGGCISMATGDINGQTVMQSCFAFNDYGRTVIVSTDFNTGETIEVAETTRPEHVGGIGFNPLDKYFYYCTGGNILNGRTYISVYDMNGTWIKDIMCYANRKIGHIAFHPVTGEAYLINMSTDNDITAYTIDTYDGALFKDLTDLDTAEGAAAMLSTVPFDTGIKGQRQGAYMDGEFLYILRGHNSASDRDRWTLIDIFKVTNSVPAYYQTITVDNEAEIEGLTKVGDNYYLLFNTVHSGLIAEVSLKARDLDLINRSYPDIVHATKPVTLGSNTYDFYVDGTADNYFVDGTDDYPFNRLETAIRFLPSTPADGYTFHLSHDLTVNGTYYRTQWRCVLNKLTVVGDGTAVLPRQAFADCANVVLNNVTIKCHPDNGLQIYETPYCNVTGVTLIPNLEGTTNVIEVEGSSVTISTTSISSGTFTNAINVKELARVKGRLEYDGTNTRIGEYALTVNTDKFRNDGAYFVVTNDGIYINAHVVATSDISIDDVVLSLPTTYKVAWTLDRLAFPSDPFIAAGDNRIYYDSTDKDFKTALAIESGTALVINGFVPVGSLSI